MYPMGYIPWDISPCDISHGAYPMGYISWDVSHGTYPAMGYTFRYTCSTFVPRILTNPWKSRSPYGQPITRQVLAMSPFGVFLLCAMPLRAGVGCICSRFLSYHLTKATPIPLLPKMILHVSNSCRTKKSATSASSRPFRLRPLRRARTLLRPARYFSPPA